MILNNGEEIIRELKLIELIKKESCTVCKWNILDLNTNNKDGFPGCFLETCKFKYAGIKKTKMKLKKI
jgi:hypothetical protein